MRAVQRAAVAAAGVAVLLTSALGAAAPGQAAAAQARGYICQSGDACMYNAAGEVVAHYYNYGTYNLSNVFDNHLWWNHQTGLAMVRMYTGYNGTGVEAAIIYPGKYRTVNMTSINSIRLTPS